MSVTIDGSAGVTTNTGAVYNGLQSTTAQASTAGTSILFTSIPLWVKRITVMFDGVSTNGTSLLLIQLGSGSLTTSGYLGSAAIINATPNVVNMSTGFNLDSTSNAAAIRYVIATFTNISGNIWVCAGNGGRSDTAATSNFGGRISLSGTLDRVNITTAGGTDTFDAGTINLIYE